MTENTEEDAALFSLETDTFKPVVLKNMKIDLLEEKENIFQDNCSLDEPFSGSLQLSLDKNDIFDVDIRPKTPKQNMIVDDNKSEEDPFLIEKAVAAGRRLESFLRLPSPPYDDTTEVSDEDKTIHKEEEEKPALSHVKNWISRSAPLQSESSSNENLEVETLELTGDNKDMKENSASLEKAKVAVFLRLPSPPFDITEEEEEMLSLSIGNSRSSSLQLVDNTASLEKTGAADQSLACLLRMPSPLYHVDTEVIEEEEVICDHTNDEEVMFEQSNENEKVQIFEPTVDSEKSSAANQRLVRFLRMSSRSYVDETEVTDAEEQIVSSIVENGGSSTSLSQDYSENGKEVAEILGAVRKNNVKNPVALQLESAPGSEDNSVDENEEVESLEDLRAKNIAKMTAFINSLRNPEMEEQMAKNMKRKVPSGTKTFMNQKLKRTGKQHDSTVRFNVSIPVEIRKSKRLRKQDPHYCEQDLDNIQENVRNVYLKRPNTIDDDCFIEDLEEVVYKPKRKSSKRSGFHKKEEERIIIPAENVTQAMLDNIAVRVKGKVYSQIGTTCHQCRQKTLDQKTCCRNVNCTGIQGMFCGVCIKNRYGEDCAEALLDPNWICPVCRGKCNCSICRNRQGKRPTGVLTPLALQQGYESVDHFLTGLRGEGDKPEEDHRWALQRDPEALLGFSDSGRRAHMGGDNVVNMNCGSCAMTDCNNPENLLGFTEDGSCAVMGGYKLELLY